MLTRLSRSTFVSAQLFASHLSPLVQQTATGFICCRESKRPSLVASSVTVSASGFRLFSGASDNDDDEEEEEEEANPADRPAKLEALKFKDYDVDYLRDLEERGELQLQPFYQRGYTWTPKQASQWIESILRGYPCLPEITLLSTIDEDEREKYAVFDGQQRLTSIMLYIVNKRSNTWREKKSGDDSFPLQQLEILKYLEGKRYQDLSVKEQNAVKKYDVRCAIIPASWSMADYIDFFKRIQSGGTPMSDHELRRALSQGPFTDLLDRLSNHELVKQALGELKEQKRDFTQQLLLRYFQFRVDPGRFGKPTLAQNGLETMKHLNRDMRAQTGEEFYKNEHLVDPLMKSLNLIVHIFRRNEPFRRPVQLVKGGDVANNDRLNKVWINSSKLNERLWDCTVATFSHDEILKREMAVKENAEAIRNALIEVMQTHPAFTGTLRSIDISRRVQLFVAEVLSIMEDSCEVKPTRVSPQVRRELIKVMRESSEPCSLCGQPLSPYDEHLHIDHIQPVSKGGTNDISNLQVVHKTCNLRKSNTVDELNDWLV